MTDPAAFAAQQQQQLTAADYNARTLMFIQQQQQAQQYQQQLAAQAAAGAGGAAAAAAARAQPAKPVSRAPSRPAPSRQPNRSRREYDSDDDDDDEFEDYAHLLSQAEREKRKKRLVGSGDRESDDDYMTPPESSSSSEEEESSSEEEEEDDGEGEVTTSEEEDFGYGPPKKDRELQMRRRRGSDSESDGERRRSAKAKSDGREQFLRAVDPVLRRQLLRFFEAVMKQNANKKAPGSNAWPPLPAISLSLAEWDKAEQQRMAFCELLNLCPVEAKADKPEPYHYPRQTCATGINYYCTFQPDRPQPAKGQPAPNQEWVKRFEDRVKQWFALEPIGQYMTTIPAITAEEKTADAAYVAAIQTAINPPAAAAAAGKQKKNKREDAGSDDDEKGKKRGGNADGARKKQKTKKAGDSDEDDHKSGAAAAAAAGIAAAPKGMAPPQPALPSAWRTLFLQQLDVSIRRQILQLYAATNPERLIQGHRENFSAKYGKDLIGINFERACELSGVTPKMYDAKAAQLHVLNYFNFRPSIPATSPQLQLPTPSFVYAFQTQVREWLRSAPVQALLASEYYVQPDAQAQSDDAEFLKAQAEARAQPLIEYAYSVPGLPGVAPSVKSGPA